MVLGVAIVVNTDGKVSDSRLVGTTSCPYIVVASASRPTIMVRKRAKIILNVVGIVKCVQRRREFE